MPSQQFQDKDIIVFSEFNGMNTQSDRHDLDEKKAAWMENLQPIGPNNLLSVPAPAAALKTIAGETITKQYYFNYTDGTDYIIAFTASGAGYAVTNPGAVQTKFANSGTFSATPDCTQWGTSVLLIADSIAGYCSWNSIVFVQYGGVSPNIVITAGGSGYTSPTASVSGGSGSGATFSVNEVGGVITSIVLTNSGTGYIASDTLTLSISDGGGGSGATATVEPWPNVMPHPTTLAVFQGRVWLAHQNTVTYTGVEGYDDFASANASGSFTINDPDLVHSVTALRNYNNYLFIFGDNSVKQIGNISVSGTTTSFTLVTLTSDQGTTFRDSIVSFNRLVVFANTVGVYIVFGSSVEKVSDEMDGIFRDIDFTQNLSAAVNDINNIHTFMLLVKYKGTTTRSLILGFLNKKWFVMSQGDSLQFIVTGIVDGTTQTFSTSGSDITEILADPTGSVNIILSSSLTSHGAPFLGKKTIRYATVQTATAISSLQLTVESDRDNEIFNYNTTAAIQFVNNSQQNITFFGSGAITFVGTTPFQYQTGNTQGVSGIYLGFTLIGSCVGFSFNSAMLEFGATAAFGSTQL